MIGEESMDTVTSMRETTEALIAYGATVGVDLGAVTQDSTFIVDGRWVFLWRESGVIKYNLQGSVQLLPVEFRNSASAFRGSWSEAGSVPGLPEAVALVKAWVLDRAEVDQLPPRDRKRYGIG